MQEEKLCGLAFALFTKKKVWFGLQNDKLSTFHWLSMIDMLGNLMKFTSYIHDFVSYYPIRQKGAHSIGVIQ